MNTEIRWLFPVLLLVAACEAKLQTYDFPDPVDTESKEIRLLADTVFGPLNGVLAKADFPAARLASFGLLDSSAPESLVFLAEIPAENEPINASPWYAFQVLSDSLREIEIVLRYPEGFANRYLPKISPSLGGPWTYLPTNAYDTTGRDLRMRLAVGPEGLYIAGQAVINADSTLRYLQNLQQVYPALQLDSIGQSAQGRPLWLLRHSRDKRDDRPVLLLMSRQHPPEISGFQAFQAFLERILAADPLAAGFRESYQIIVFPMINPDGVDQGHWRHNAQGIDLNRDWGYYRQPETRQVVTWLQHNLDSDQVHWAMDFHSTQYDVLYVHDSTLVDFQRADMLGRWVEALRQNLQQRFAEPYRPVRDSSVYWAAIVGQDTLRVEPEGFGRPTSASLAAKHFNTVAVTYEVADEQDRKYIREKAELAAELLMQELLNSAPR